MKHVSGDRNDDDGDGDDDDDDDDIIGFII